MDESIVSLISINRGANVKYTFENLEKYLRDGGDPDSTSNGGITILKQATLKGDIRTIELLLEYHADPNLGDTRNRVLMHWGNTPPLFVTNGNVETTRLLLEGGANVNYMTMRYGTPLHRAAQHGYNNVVRLLLEYGADPDINANVKDPNWDQERDRDPITGHRIAVINAPQVNVNPEELAILNDHLDTAEIIQGDIPTKQRFALSTSMIEEGQDTSLRYLDYDTIQKLLRYINYNPGDPHNIRHRIIEERENKRIADYLDTMNQYGSGKRSIFNRKRKKTRRRLYRQY
jgi:hypothetical protein